MISLLVIPVLTHRTKQKTCVLMVEASENFTLRCDPLNYNTLQAPCIICPCTWRTFLDLESQLVYLKHLVWRENLWDLQLITHSCHLHQLYVLQNSAICCREQYKFSFAFTDWMSGLNCGNNHLLGIEGLIRTDPWSYDLLCMKKASHYDSVNGTHCIYHLTKVSTIVNQWILQRASYLK